MFRIESCCSPIQTLATLPLRSESEMDDNTLSRGALLLAAAYSARAGGEVGRKGTRSGHAVPRPTVVRLRRLSRDSCQCALVFY